MAHSTPPSTERLTTDISTFSTFTTDTNYNSSQYGSLQSKNYWALLLLVFPLFTLFGNILVVLSVVKEKTLHNATNYFIVSLAAADISLAVLVMPLATWVEMNNKVWQYGRLFCDVFVMFDVLFCTSSILNLVAISLDRFFAVMRPIQYSRHNNRVRVWTTIALVWVISFLIALPIACGINNTSQRQESECAFNNADYIISSSFGSFYIPAVAMIILYYRIFRAIHKRAQRAIKAREGRVFENMNSAAGLLCLTPASTPMPQLSTPTPKPNSGNHHLNNNNNNNNNDTNNSDRTSSSPMVEHNAIMATSNSFELQLSSSSLSRPSALLENTQTSPCLLCNDTGPTQSKPFRTPQLSLHFADAKHILDRRGSPLLETYRTRSSPDTDTASAASSLCSCARTPDTAEFERVICSPFLYEEARGTLSLAPLTNNESPDSFSIPEMIGSPRQSRHLPPIVTFLSDTSTVHTNPLVQLSEVQAAAPSTNRPAPPTLQFDMSDMSVLPKSAGDLLKPPDHRRSGVRPPLPKLKIVQWASSAIRNPSTSTPPTSVQKVNLLVRTSSCCPEQESALSSSPSSSNPPASRHPAIAYSYAECRVSERRHLGLLLVAWCNCRSRSRRRESRGADAGSGLAAARLGTPNATIVVTTPPPSLLNTAAPSTLVKPLVVRNRERSAARKEKKATKTLAIVLGLFLFCWLPFFTLSVLNAICLKVPQWREMGVFMCHIPDDAYALGVWLGYINSFLNPIIYTIFNNEFRRAFKKLLHLK